MTGRRGSWRGLVPIWPHKRLTLQQIAAEAGVTVQTIIRRFGSKEGLFEAIGRREGARILAERQPSNPEGGGLEAAVHALVAHYEHDGRTVLHFLYQEGRLPIIADIVARRTSQMDRATLRVRSRRRDRG